MSDITPATPVMKLSTRTKFWMCIANISCAVIAFYLPLPESLAEFETANYIANWVVIAVSLGFALYYAKQFRAEYLAKFTTPPREIEGRPGIMKNSPKPTLAD